ncbi:type I restriction-modification system subunit M [Microbacterium sp. MYb64]|uniref:type I restriction-modification system subunit M n=1 Tax=Microbacterium sp. MYb64 TaxID=1848691 RepID=UPI000CFC4068|nr:type I restriction-modification system subunit M [Microbacterium sp. MYb64]PRB05012.1 type I restriction-modification system subunit M [Microbacterium sp. MYb64]
MNPTVTQQQINNAAWAACDTFRGVVDATQYKDYILVMLFLKYISDIWIEDRENLGRRFAEDPRKEEKVKRLLDRERFVLPEDSSFYNLYEQRKADNIGELINIALAAIEEKNRAKLDGVFRNIDFNSEVNLGETKERNRRLAHLLEDFHRPALDLRPSRVGDDIIGETYIYLISRFASDAGKKAGEFYTPRSVSVLLAKLAAPKTGDTIFDPACGSGSLLIEAAREVGSNNYALYGQEVNGATSALARMNMFMHANDSATIAWGNTLTGPRLLDENRLRQFDVVVGNPPFSLDKWGAEDAASDEYKRFWRGVPPRSKGDYAFITHMIEVAKRHTGRVAVIVPHGVLFRGGAEGRIRKALIEENLLDAVIGLPANLFTTTGIPVAILLFDRSREAGGANSDRDDVLFIDASREFSPVKSQNLLESTHIDKIVQTYRGRVEIERYSQLAEIGKIAENDYNLNIPRYVDTFEPEPEVDIAAVQREIEKVEAELVEVRAKIAGYLKELGIDG